jgi:hypothetical protein
VNSVPSQTLAEQEHAAVLALLADGEASRARHWRWALGTSQRIVQRTPEELTAEDRVKSFRLGRARRWVTRLLQGFPTTLLLPALLPGS